MTAMSTLPDGARLAGTTILIVDDDEDILGSMELAMRAEGATTCTANDGHAAIAAQSTHQPDAVVLDMMLPKQSGFLVLEQLQELEAPPIVVMVTANEGRRHEKYAQSLGVHAYLQKPVPLQRLIDTVCRLLDERESAAGDGE